MADEKHYTQEEVDALVQEKLAAAKAEGDTAFQKLWDEAKSAKARAKALESLGDPEEIQAKLAKLQELEVSKKAEKAGVTSADLERLRGEIRQDLEKEYSPFKNQAESLSKEIRELRLDNVVKGSMAKHGVRAERVDALFRLTRDAWDLTEDGKPLVASRPGTEVDKYITDHLSKEYPEFFEGTGSSGGGASKSVAGGGGNGRAVAAGDGTAFIQNLADIATGKVAVRS